MLRRKLGMVYDPLWRPIRFSCAIIVLCVYNLCMHILYSEYIFYITCYYYVCCLCIAWVVYSFRPTTVYGFGTRPPKRSTGVFMVPSPLFVIKWPHSRGVATAWAQRVWYFIQYAQMWQYVPCVLLHHLVLRIRPRIVVHAKKLFLNEKCFQN